MCAPSLGLEELRPLNAEPSPILSRALEQHGVFVRTLRDYGVSVTVLEPASESPRESLVADCALLLPQGAILTRPSSVDHRGDVAAVEAALTASGVPIAGRIEAPGLLDATDVAIAGDRLFVGVPRGSTGLGARSNALGREQLAAYAKQADLRVVELAIAPEAPRLRNVFNVVAGDAIVASPDMVDLVPVSDMRVIEVPRGEEFAAGVLALRERCVLANLRFRYSIGLLRAAKIDVVAIDLWEFGKVGVGPFQLALATKRN